MKRVKRYHRKERKLGQRRRTYFLSALFWTIEEELQNLVNVLCGTEHKNHTKHLMAFHKAEGILTGCF